jgi:hypothetical protein
MANMITWQCPKCLTDNRDNVHASGKYAPTCGECEMRMPSRVMTGTVTEIEPHGQTVSIDADDYGTDRHLAILNLHGYCRIPDAQVGDRVKVWYVSDPRSGLWYGRKLHIAV